MNELVSILLYIDVLFLQQQILYVDSIANNNLMVLKQLEFVAIIDQVYYELVDVNFALLMVE